jgi:hypothetical protein
MKQLQKKFAWMLAFAVAMGFLEAAVVVYLRELYYPSGFAFPLVPLPRHIAITELFREASTIIMLVAAGAIAGKTNLQRFAWFLFSFGIWDIFYYVFLYLTLGWPASLTTWDILFLIPVPWVGPVWAPCLISLLMIAASAWVICVTEINPHYRVNRLAWVSAAGGALLCGFTFMLDYIRYSGKGIGEAGGLDAFTGYVPGTFNVISFGAGFLLMAVPFIHAMITFKPTPNQTSNENQ